MKGTLALGVLGALIAVATIIGGAAFADSPTPVPEPLAIVAPIPKPGPGQHLVQWVDGSTYIYPCGTPTPEIIHVLSTDWEITQWIQGAEYAVDRGRYPTVTTTDIAKLPDGVSCGTVIVEVARPTGWPPTFSPLWVGPIPAPAPVTVVPLAAPSTPTAAAPAAPAVVSPSPASSQPHPAAATTPAATAPVPPVIPAIPVALLTEWQRMQHRVF